MGRAKTAVGKKPQKVRIFEGKVVKPALFDGKMTGKGKYIAAMIDDVLVLDPKTGNPIPYLAIGRTE